MTGYRLSDLDVLEKHWQAESRDSFLVFRRYMHPKMKINWFVREITNHLQQFYEDYENGLRPKLAIATPPQHGKSTLIIDFIAWSSGKNPGLKQFFASFSDRLGVRANTGIQRIYDSEKYKKIFPRTRISTKGNKSTIGYARNSELIEFVGEEGYFRNTTVRGSITGEALDIGYIDDAIKGREAANSETIRNSTWEWLTDDFMTRFADDAAMLIIMTRWHIDDPLGRLKDALGDDIKIISYPAIAEVDEPNRKAGEPLFPELKSLEFLMKFKAMMHYLSWESLFQQNPKVAEGKIIRGSWFRYYSGKPPVRILERKIFADTAQKTKEANDYSVFECWGVGEDDNIYLLDLIRDKWEAPELEVNARLFWKKHKMMNEWKRGEMADMGPLTSMEVEDKSSGTGLIQSLKDEIKINGIQRSIDRYTRVLDAAGPLENGRVFIPDDKQWAFDFKAECEAFTADDSHQHDDQIDPMCDAITIFILNRSKINVWKILGKNG